MANYIHPSAIIDASVKLGDNNHIGPHCIIGEDVVLGNNNHLMSGVLIYQHTRIGDNNTFHHCASAGTDPQDLKYNGELTYLNIGDKNTFREFVTLNRSATVDEDSSIGSNCLLMAYVHLAHNCHLGNNVILANAVNLAGHITIEDNASIGGMVAIHQFVKIGRYTFIGGKSGIKKDVPPFTRGEGFPYTLHGLNTVGLQRKGFSPDDIKAIKEIYRIFYRKGLNTAQAMAEIDLIASPTILQQEFIDFVRNSERGICR
ncbi:MAG: acyl-ACP--UDP-N-acetylglucosamine O-acyltransferase [Candidatus Cloacimonetes bacterium]|nr:acyl-ACP--UDP-N-acetylglucosamine O-acyltransferase [Candidatus Cloacimonadota bacterium]